jgi:hypothetical protein
MKCRHFGGSGVSDCPRSVACLIRRLALGAQLVTFVFNMSLHLAQAAGTPLNGSSPRPFYIFAHNPNTIEEAKAALSDGANALEPDVQVGASGELVVAHNANRSGKISLVDYLSQLHDLAFNNNLALVVFDVKPEAASADHGLEILTDIRNHLNEDSVNVAIIISVATRKDGAIFDKLIGPQAVVQLGPREGIQIDEEDDAGAIVNFFFEKGYTGNIGFGDGTLGPGPHLPTAMDGAAWSRAAIGYPRMVTYVYTINVESSMHLFIDAGVDGIITDNVPKLGRVLRERSDVFLATIHDNPFKPRNETYGIKITTADVSGAGTDAHLTFTLNGTLGVATVTVDTEPTGRMEHGKTNYVTVPSKNLGPLKSITIHNDGAGNKPDWNLHDLTVYSGQWLKPDLSFHYTARLDDWVRGNSSTTLPFRVDEFVWGGFTSSSEGTLTNPWKRISEGYNSVAPGGTIHIAASQYREKITLSKPCRLEFSDAHGSGPAVIGGL